MKGLVVGHLYPDELNLYGDNGNVEVVAARCVERGIKCEVIDVGVGKVSSYPGLGEVNLLFMGGGPDSSQKSVYEDFLIEKKEFVSDYVYSGKVGLFVCGSYQLLGEFYRSADGSELKGLGIFNAHTVHFGKNKSRCIGNVRAVLSETITADPVFKNVDFLGPHIFGFENHGGRTYLGSDAVPFAKVTHGHGNNSEDGTEGLLLGNCVGTYFHGPLLAKNPHLADYLIAKALGVSELPKLDDKLSIASYTASKKLR
ncbi:MAG: glutamine amidotransferase [Patescibacteria group bacterium]|nr:MAG: glutamine amidotransferase [Patescibacteria group bacterium]